MKARFREVEKGLALRRNPRGSDGCIVPRIPEQFIEVMNGLTSDGGGILTVLGAQGGSRFA